MRNGLKALLMCAVITMIWSNAGVVAAPPAAIRAYSAARFALEIDGNFAGFVSTAEGGLAFGDVVKVPGEEFFLKKHLGNAGYRDIRLEFGADMEKSFYGWIAAALQGEHVRLSGAILAADFNNNVISRLEFQRAQITEVTFPALDAAGKDAAKMSIVLSPEQTVHNRKPSGKLSANSSKLQKRWLTSSFRFSIDGLDTKKVSKIDALTIKLPRQNFGDEEACYTCEGLPSGPTKVDFPNVIMTIGEPAPSVYDWFEDFVIAGNNADANEKGGTLEYLTPDLQTILFSLKFSNLGVFEVMPVVVTAGSDTVPRLLVGMYCESMVFLTEYK